MTHVLRVPGPLIGGLHQLAADGAASAPDDVDCGAGERAGRARSVTSADLAMVGLQCPCAAQAARVTRKRHGNRCI